jgi:hypothetical protein
MTKCGKLLDYDLKSQSTRCVEDSHFSGGPRLSGANCGKVEQVIDILKEAGGGETLSQSKAYAEDWENGSARKMLQVGEQD